MCYCQFHLFRDLLWLSSKCPKFLHCLLSRHKNTSKKRNLYYNGSPQQVNPFQNVLNPSLLIRLSKYLPKVTPKEFEGKRKGKSGKDETSLFGSKFFWGGKKWGEKQKNERSLSAVNSIFSPRKKKSIRGTKKKQRSLSTVNSNFPKKTGTKKTRGWRSKIKSIYP